MKKISNIQNIECYIQVETCKDLTKDFWLPSNKIYILVIDYPFKKETRYEIKTKNGMGLAGLTTKIRKCYVRKYKSAKETPMISTVTTSVIW